MSKPTSDMSALEFKDRIIDALETGRDLADEMWLIRSRTSMKVQWLKLEEYQRVVFQLYAGNTLTERQALICLSELLGAITGRGAGF